MMEPVAQRDSAFLWETEALRTVPHRGTPNVAPEERLSPRADWVTLREASEVTGVPVATLRKWALRDGVPSYLEETPVGQLRIVSLQGIYRRAEELGRQVARRTGTSGEPRVIELPADPVVPPAKAESPEGTMLVPLDAWTKVLNQLGNLHEAGQQLAEARERAAKAETEAAFLRERLAELRAELGQTRVEPASSPSVPPPAPETAPSTWTTVRRLLSIWKAPPKK